MNVLIFQQMKNYSMFNNDMFHWTLRLYESIIYFKPKIYMGYGGRAAPFVNNIFPSPEFCNVIKQLRVKVNSFLPRTKVE